MKLRPDAGSRSGGRSGKRRFAPANRPCPASAAGLGYWGDSARSEFGCRVGGLRRGNGHQRSAPLAAGAKPLGSHNSLQYWVVVVNHPCGFLAQKGLNGMGGQGSSGPAANWPTFPEGRCARRTRSSELTETKSRKPQLHFSDRSHKTDRDRSNCWTGNAKCIQNVKMRIPKDCCARTHFSIRVGDCGAPTGAFRGSFLRGRTSGSLHTRNL